MALIPNLTTQTWQKFTDAFLIKLAIRLHQAQLGAPAEQVVQSLEAAVRSFARQTGQVKTEADFSKFFDDFGEAVHAGLGEAAEPFQRILHETWRQHLRDTRLLG